MIKGLPSKLKSHLCLHFTIPSSPSSDSTYSKLFVFKKETQPKPLHLAGGLGSGEETIFILSHLLKSITTFEIKLPSVQIITCAMLGCYFGLGFCSSDGRIPVLFLLQQSNCCNQCDSLFSLCPAGSQEVLQGRKCGRSWACQGFLVLVFCCFFFFLSGFFVSFLKACCSFPFS